MTMSGQRGLYTGCDVCFQGSLKKAGSLPAMCMMHRVALLRARLGGSDPGQIRRAS